MASSQVIGQASTPNRTPSASDIRGNTAEASRLYQRGVAAARGGQRRIAAGLLTRSVQLDPQNEGAWLWLSGVLDDPHQIAFCLHTVLKLNPVNERARQGLIWLEERQLLKGEPRPSPLLDMGIAETPAQRKAREGGESWWVHWRQLHRDMNRLRMLFWAIPVVLVFLSLVLHQAFSLAAGRSVLVEVPSAPPPQIVVQEIIPDTEPPPPPTILHLAAPVVPAKEPLFVQHAQVVDYLNEFHGVRYQLRSAVDRYREATGKPGSALTHVSAARSLHTTVENAIITMEGLQPPPSLHYAHEVYKRGLHIELTAVDNLLDFYSSYKVESATSAALHFQEANAYFQHANQLFDQHLNAVREHSSISSHTIR